MVQMIPTRSSTVEAVGYDPAASALHVHFLSGETGQYAGVPNHIYLDLLAAESVGSFLHSRVKKEYTWVGGPKVEKGATAVAVLIPLCPSCSKMMVFVVAMTGPTVRCENNTCVRHLKSYKAPCQRVDLEEVT